MGKYIAMFLEKMGKGGKFHFCFTHIIRGKGGNRKLNLFWLKINY